MTPPAEPTSSSTSPQAPVLSQAEARRAAAAAEARAAAAIKVADHAKAIAKKAKAAAAKESAEAAKLREIAQTGTGRRAELSTVEAKAKLLEAARKIHPLQDARASAGEHPFATVGIAAGAGAVLGATSGSLAKVIGGGANLTAALLRVARPLLLVAGKFAAAQALAKKTAGGADAETTPNETIHESGPTRV